MLLVPLVFVYQMSIATVMDNKTNLKKIITNRKLEECKLLIVKENK